MKCHYQVLGVARNASDDDIKRAYRKLALKWHPDKNLENQDEAKEQFQVIQQAWEVLSDPHERTWYDNHREAILKGGIGDDYKDDAIDLFRYFSGACFKGYGDDEKGFYAIYRNVFEKLASEDAEFAKEGDSDEEVPGFGDSQSSYENVVHNFYAYWQSYATKRSYAWLDPYDIRDAPNRKALRLMEKENKKVRDKARRERNEQVRNLVSFVRKRDKRVQLHAQILAERAKQNKIKTQERKKRQLLERQNQLKDHTASGWAKFSNFESELKNIEVNLAAEFGEELSSAGDSDDDDYTDSSNALYCVACNKIFKTHRAFTNHENSKKHKDSVAILKANMARDDEEFNNSEEEDSSASTLETEESPIKDETLATDPQMPDFTNHSKNADCANVQGDDDSDGELVSGDDDNDWRNNAGDSCSPATGPQIDDDFLHFPGPSKDIDDAASDEELVSDQEDETIRVPLKSKTKKKKKKAAFNAFVEAASDDESASAIIDEDSWLSKKQRKKQQQKKTLLSRLQSGTEETLDETAATDDASATEQVQLATKREDVGVNVKDEDTSEINATVANGKVRGAKAKKAARKQAERESAEMAKESNVSSQDLEHCCVTCKVQFPSKNKLFDHLKRTGHSVYIPDLAKLKRTQERPTKRREGRKEK